MRGHKGGRQCVTLHVAGKGGGGGRDTPGQPGTMLYRIFEQPTGHDQMIRSSP